MTYEELKKAYDEMSEKCSDLEKKIESKNLEIEKNRIEIENNKLEIENLTEQLLKRNRMLFGKKAERSKYLNVDGQLAFDYKGTVKPWFFEQGGGVQYMFENSIQYYIDNGYLEVYIG